MKEYRWARIRTCTSLTLDWNSGHKQTSDYYMYNTLPKEGRTIYDKDIDEPKLSSLEMLHSKKSPPPKYVSEMSDYYYHHYVG